MSEDEKGASEIRSLSLNTLFQLLSNHRRRIVLADLLAHESKLTVNDLTEEIVVQEQDAPVTEVPSEVLTRTRIALHHNHIPKLDETPLIEYDRERNIVEPTEQLEELEPFLSRVVEADSVQSLCRNW